MIREIKRELVEYIRENTGIDKETIIKVLQAEESFLELQIKRAMGRDKA